MDNKKTGIFISELRKEKSLTQKELAEKLFVTDRAVSKWERGIGYPDITIIIKLSEILEVSVNEILYGKRLENIKEEENKEIIKESVKFYTKLKQQSVLKKCLIFIPLGIMIFFLLIMVFTEVNRGIMPFTNGKISIEKWPSFSKFNNKQKAKKLFNALLDYDYEELEKRIAESHGRRVDNYIKNFMNLENLGVEFTNYYFLAGGWTDYGYGGNYIIEFEYNGIKDTIQLGIIEFGKRFLIDGIMYSPGYIDKSGEYINKFDKNILKEVIKTFNEDVYINY